MAVGPCVRVCLHFSDLDQETCWFLVDFKKIPTVECMQRMIGRKFYKSEETSFKLTLKGSLLPAWESSFILRDDDQIIVEHEVMAHRSSEYWSKKKKRKKKLMTNSKKFYFSSAKHDSPGCTQRKISRSSIGEDESILAPEPFQNTVSTPDAESEEQKSYKKKKMKLDCVNDLNLDIEELPAPNKKLKISKPLKTEHSNKKKNVTRESRPEIIEAVRDHVKVISSQPEDLKEEKVNLCDKSDSHLNLKKVKSEIIKVLNKVSVNLDNVIPMVTSDTHPNGKDVSNVVKEKENSREGNKNLTQTCDSNEKSLRKDLEPSIKSSVSGLEKSYNVQEESTSHSVQEKVEVYTIEEEDLKNICQSLNDGETLTIDQDKVKVIDVENTSNSSWLDCVEVDCSFPEETRKTDTSTAKEISKGNGNNPRRRRRRRGQRGFACSPFIYAMSQSLDSDADNRSPVSTPVASQLKYPPSSNNSQKHFHFTSDTDEDEEEEEENISQPSKTGVDQSKTENNFESSKTSLSSEKIVTNGTEDSNSSFVSQGGGEDKILPSSQKHSSKKSVHFALENVPCASFDSSQEPVIYKRGQRRSFPTLIRQQQLNTSLESCSSICTSVEDDPKTASVNGCTPKPPKEYNLLPAIVGYPRAGDKIAFKRLEIGDDYTPRLSNFIEAKVISFKEDSKQLTMKVTSPKNNRRKEGKFELFYENDEDIIIDQPDDVIESVELSTLQEVKLLK